MSAIFIVGDGPFFIKEMAIRATNDQLIAVWVLSQLDWSLRRIARLKLPSSHHTITAYYAEAHELIKSKKLPIHAKDERKLRIHAIGNAIDLEYIEGNNNHNNCGGGKRIRPHHFDSGYKENSRDD